MQSLPVYRVLYVFNASIQTPTVGQAIGTVSVYEKSKVSAHTIRSFQLMALVVY